MFKKLTNVRPAKSSTPEFMTTPTSGTMVLSAPAASLMKIGNGDYLAVIEEEDTNSEYHGVWLTKGAKGEGEDSNFGAKLAGENGGSLQMSSSSAYQCLKGTDTKRIVYTVGEGVNHPDFTSPIYKLTFSREEEKSVRKAKEAKGESNTDESAQ